MSHLVRWQLVGRSGKPLDKGSTGEKFYGYGDAVAAVIELLRPYSQVTSYFPESYWLARRSCDADLAVWVWIEHLNIEDSKPLNMAWSQRLMSPNQISATSRNPVAQATAAYHTAKFTDLDTTISQYVKNPETATFSAS